ncbi:MAG: BREX system ATP-binding domain-containing protein [Caldilineaceae bacterium]
MTTLRIQLLGGFQLLYADQPVEGLQQARLQSLLAYLLFQRHAAQPRQHLAFLLWPDSSEAQALTNLRKQLLFLRRMLPDPDHFLRVDAKIVQWNPAARFTLDVAEFEETLTRAASLVGEAAIAVLQSTRPLYRGELLPSCYDDWITPKRAELHTKFSQTLERLLLLQEDRRDYPAAIEVGQQLLRHDPLQETTYRRLMRLHARNGDRATALNVYHACVTILQRELAVEPNADTQAAYERLLQQETPGILRQQPLALAQSPFVGRQVEWEKLQEIWRGVARGHARFVLIAGEAGIGKTRLAEELLDWAAQQGIVTAHARAYAAEGRLAYAPVIEWLRTPALKTQLMQLEMTWLTELARLLPELLTERPGLPAPGAITESWQRHRLFEALTRALLIRKQPLLLVLDDLQWCDQETLEWIHFLLRYDPQAALLVVGTARPEEIGPRHPLATLRLGLRTNQQMTELRLVALSAADTTRLAEQMVGGKLAPDLAIHLYQDTEGNPLFIVEIVHAELNHKIEEQATNTDEPTPLLHFSLNALPSKVQTVIESRLTQLSALARKLAELAATSGRAFTFDVLAHACDCPEDEMVNGLDELCQRHIVREQGGNAYDFSHDKIREVVYAQISTARRRLFHRRIAQTLEIMYTANLEPVIGQLAAHYEKAGMPDLAIPYYQRAAQAALRIYANHEAIQHFTRGLALLASLPESTSRAKQELTFLLDLGPVWISIGGYAFSQVGEVYTRAENLTQQLGEPPNPAILRALAIFYIGRREYEKAYMQGEQILALAHPTENQIDPVLDVEGHYVLGVTTFWQGKFLEARMHLEQAVARYDVQQHNVYTTLYSQDPGVICLIRSALALWQLGYPVQAQQRRDEALALAYKLAHPFSLAYALAFAIWLSSDLRDEAATTALIESLQNHCQKYDIPYWLPVVLIFQGWLLTEQGQVDPALTQIRSGMTAHQAVQAGFYRPRCLILLAQAYMQSNAIEEALAALDEGLATVVNYGDMSYAAELHRLKGEYLAKLGTAISAAEASLYQAYTLAREQQAKSLELRAAMSLSRLWQKQDKCEQARQLLVKSYGWFTEGFETVDLKEAKALLVALG